jgi:hypothetical protein
MANTPDNIKHVLSPLARQTLLDANSPAPLPASDRSGYCPGCKW